MEFKKLEKRINRKGVVSYWENGSMVGKRCTKCNKDKEINEFGFANKKKGIYRPDCKECHVKQDKIWQKNNPQKANKRTKKWAENNKEKLKEYKKEWIQNNPEYHKTYYKNNKNHYLEMCKKYRIKRKEENISTITNTLKETNPIFKQLDLPIFGCIYKITNIKTNHVYIGQSVLPLEVRYRDVNIIKGWIKDRREKTGQKFLEELIEENLVAEIIDYGVCRYHLDKLEVHWINYYDSCNNGYNNRIGNHNTTNGYEDFLQILKENGLEFIDGKLIEKEKTSTER